MNNTPIYLVDIMTAIVQKVSDELEASIGAVHFIYGHPVEAVNTILEMTKNPTSAAKKYPLIFMYMDFDEEHDGTIDQGVKVSLRFALATWTDPKWKAAERYTNTFKPILYPLYDEFLYRIASSGYFLVTSENTIPHTKTDRPYWGSSNGQGNVANDHCDVIELTNMKLNVFFPVCSTHQVNVINQ